MFSVYQGSDKLDWEGLTKFFDICLQQYKPFGLNFCYHVTMFTMRNFKLIWTLWKSKVLFVKLINICNKCIMKIVIILTLFLTTINSSFFGNPGPMSVTMGHVHQGSSTKGNAPSSVVWGWILTLSLHPTRSIFFVLMHLFEVSYKPY